MSITVLEKVVLGLLLFLAFGSIYPNPFKFDVQDRVAFFFFFFALAIMVGRAIDRAKSTDVPKVQIKAPISAPAPTTAVPSPVPLATEPHRDPTARETVAALKRQAAAMEAQNQQLAVTAEESRYADRARLIVADVECSKPRRLGTTQIYIVEVSFRVRNVGKTEAQMNTPTIRASWGIRMNEVVDPANLGDAAVAASFAPFVRNDGALMRETVSVKDQTGRLTAEGQFLRQDVLKIQGPLKDLDIRHATFGGIAVWIVIQYQDIYGKDRTTSYYGSVGGTGSGTEVSRVPKESDQGRNFAN